MLLENGLVLVQTSQNGPHVPKMQNGQKCVNSKNMIDALLDKTEEHVSLLVEKSLSNDEANSYLVAAII